jgi:hypothetical protein
MIGVRSSQMRRSFMFGLAVVTLTSVVAMFVSPAVHLPLTALRGWTLARLAKLGLLVAATVTAGFVFDRARDARCENREPRRMANRELRDFVCSLLC